MCTMPHRSPFLLGQFTYILNPVLSRLRCYLMEYLKKNPFIKWLTQLISRNLGLDIISETTEATVMSLVGSILTIVGAYFISIRVKRWTSTSGRGIPLIISTPEQARAHWKGKRVDVMKIRDSEQPDVIKCLCPATGQLLGLVKASTASDIDLKVKAAHHAWEKTAWRQAKVEDRRAVLQTILRYISEHQEEVCRIACRDTGKTMIDASLGEVMVTLEKIAWIIKNGSNALKPSKRPSSASWLMGYKAAEVRYEPLGVVCAMVSWNYPLHNLIGPIAASLFAGDAIVVKCSEQVVWSSEFFVNIAKKALEMHGYDSNLVQLVACWPEHADTLTTHPLIKHITFIGSRPVAHKVVEAAAKPLTPVVVELGGKDPLIVLDDYTNLCNVSSIIMRGVFQSAGQNCIGVERVILQSKVHDQLVEILSTRVKKLRVGSSIDEVATIDMGALISDIHLDRLEELVNDAVGNGATLVTGGKRYIHPKYPLGIYFEPTMLINVTPTMRIAQEEVFGPILLVLKAPNTIEDVISLANSCDFGLGASVFSKSMSTLNYVAGQLRCGNVALNDFATYHMCQLPFGGVDGSGYGKFGGYEGIRALCLEKSVCYDWLPFISTTIPRALDYPIISSSKAWELIRNINDMGYSTSCWGKLKGIQRTVSELLGSILSGNSSKTIQQSQHCGASSTQ